MPLFVGADRVRLEGAGRVVERTWKRRRGRFLDELEERQREKAIVETGRRTLMRFPGLVAPLNGQEISAIATILGRALQRRRDEQRELAQRAGGAR